MIFLVLWMNCTLRVFSWETMTHKGCCCNLHLSSSAFIFVFMSRHKCEDIKMLVIPLITLIWTRLWHLKVSAQAPLYKTNSFSLRSIRGGVEVEEKGTEDSISSLLVLQQQEFAIGQSHLKIKQVIYLLIPKTYFGINGVKLALAQGFFFF